MLKAHKVSLFQKILVPIFQGHESHTALTLARLLAGDGRIILVGIVGVEEGVSLSVATPLARKVRQRINVARNGDQRVQIRERVRVSYQPWEELITFIREEQPDLLILEWLELYADFGAVLPEALSKVPCDLAIVRGPLKDPPQRILVPLRGGVYAEQALRLSLSLASASQAEVTSLRILMDEDTPRKEEAFRGLALVLQNLPEVVQLVEKSGDVADTILSHAEQYDMIVMGMSAQSRNGTNPVGAITAQVLAKSEAALIAVRTASSDPVEWEGELAGQGAISILVDKWFAENTYFVDEFDNLGYLLKLKQEQGVSVSLALPALNEEATVGKVIETVKDVLMDSVQLLDEIVLIDSDSKDRTREIAQELGVPVYVHQRVLPDYGARHGKGEALWKSLYVTRGDIILWIDTDIVNIHPRFVYGLLGPLLLRKSTQFVKGFYRRPLKVDDKIQAGGGGRVTELTARPLLNLFYPELSGIIQPLSGEYGGRRTALEQLPFSSGYGVEIGLLIDVFERYGLSAIAQVDLQERIHHNQALESLSKMSFAIIQAVIRKLERRYSWGILEEVNLTMKLIRYEPGRFFLEVEEIAERERPPMIDLPEYLLRS